MIKETYTDQNGKRHELNIEMELYRVLDCDNFISSILGLPIIERDLYGICLTASDAASGGPWGDITVSFGEFIGQKNYAYTDPMWSDILNTFVSKGYAYKTTYTQFGENGINYPVYCFTEEFLRECGSEKYEMYSKVYDEYMEALEDRDRQIDME